MISSGNLYGHKARKTLTSRFSRATAGAHSEPERATLQLLQDTVEADADAEELCMLPNFVSLRLSIPWARVSTRTKSCPQNRYLFQTR